MKFFKIRNSDDAIIDSRDYPDGYDPDTILVEGGEQKFGPTKEYRIIPLEVLADEAYDPSTQKLVRQQTVEATRVTWQNVAAALSSNELENYTYDQDAEAEIDFAKTALAQLKLGNTPTGEQQRRIIIYLLSRALRDE